MNAGAPVSPWSPPQQAWLHAMGHVVYLHGSVLDALEPESAVAVPAAAEPVARQAPPLPDTGLRQPPVRREAPPQPPVETAGPEQAAGRRRVGLRLPDGLLLALARTSGCTPDDPQFQRLMENWPLAELRANPAAKRALWPQLRALRRQRRA